MGTSARRSFLEWTADPPGVSPAAHVRAFRSLVLAHVAVQSWAWALRPLDFPYTFPGLPIHAGAALLTGLCGLSLFRAGRLACALALPVVLWETAWLLPATANHGFLALVMLFLCALFDPDREGEDALLLQGLRWLAVIVFCWAGLQKALHGLYFGGEFLSWALAVGGARWVEAFAWALPGPELARLEALPQSVGSGPFRMDSLLLVLVSNAVWIGEVALGAGMLSKRLREAAAVCAIGLVLAIQTAPRELMFALLYTNLLLLFVRGEPDRRLLPLFLAGHALLLAAVAGVPGLELLLKPKGGL